MINKKKWMFIILFILLFIVICPFLIDSMIIGNDYPSNISNSEWVSFLGSYIGAIIGGVFSFVSIYLTIRFTADQNKLDRELTVRPYCTVKFLPTSIEKYKTKVLMYFSFSCGEKKNEGSVEYGTLLVTNVGVGPAVEISLESEPIDDGRVHYPLIMARDMNVMRRSENMLKPSEEGQISICIDFNFDPITEMTCSEMMPEALMKSGLGSKYIEILEKYKSFDMILLLKYCDLFHNRFQQELKMRVAVFVANEKNTDKAKYKAEMYLEEVGNPIKIEGV